VSETPSQIPAESTAASGAAPSLEKSSVSTTTILTVVVALVAGFLIPSTLKGKKDDAQKDLYSAQAELASRTAVINAERARQGLPPIEGIDQDSPEQIASRLTKDAATLANLSDRFRILLSQKEATITEKNNSLLTSEQARQSLTSQLAKLQNQLDKTLADGSDIDGIRNQLDEARNSLAPLQAKLAEFSNRPTLEEMALAKARIAELEARIATLEATPPTTEAPKLFAENAAELAPAAQSLFRGLSELEEKSDLDVVSAYKPFPSEYGATKLREISFGIGSSQINPSDKLALGDALASLPEGSMILVVGYSSASGNTDANRRLSSERATEVARNIDMAKPGNQSVQAVFLGQTQRFSSSIAERNQVCEVWQIDQKK
jgi:outer membrane protein OmpA-like peptidoglycan-associated protein